MAAPQIADAARQAEIIDLVSDSDDDGGVRMDRSPPARSNNEVVDLEDDFDGEPRAGLFNVAFFGDPGAFFPPDFAPPAEQRQNPTDSMTPEPLDRPHAEPGGEIVVIDGEEIFIPDEDDLEERAVDRSNDLPQDLTGQDELPVITADECLQRVLEIFPDINHNHVVQLYNEFDHQTNFELLPGQARLDNIIEKLATCNGNYLKQDKGKKRKREDSVDQNDFKRWESERRDIFPPALKGPMRAMLKAEFPDIPQQYINNTLDQHKFFFKAYIALAKDKDDSDDNPTQRRFGKGRSRSSANASVIAQNSGWSDLVAELEAAQRKVQIIRAQKVADDAKKKAEQENLQQAMEIGETAECQACFEDLPMNRQVHCDGDEPHFTCYDCVTTYIKTEVGDSRCKVLCTAGCGAGFPPNQLNQLEDKQLLAKLAELEQEKAIRDAGLDDLEECPFCDYKAILPPIEEDFEFRCANPECEKVSCRRCKSISHIPISCEQHAKDNKINSRHKIEEAMTAALIRSCNKCKKQFIKDYGCNKMTCPSCAHMQCYVCSESLTSYNHFAQAPTQAAGGRSSKCPLYDNVEERHEREVKEAEEAARAKVVAENPDVTADDLEIKVSDSVKKATAARIAGAGGPGGGIVPWAMPPGGPPDDVFRAVMGDDDIDDFEDAVGRQRRRQRYNMAVRYRIAANLREQQARLRSAAQAAPAWREHLPPPQLPHMAGYIPVFGIPGNQAPQYPAAPPPVEPRNDNFAAMMLQNPDFAPQRPYPAPPEAHPPDPYEELERNNLARVTTNRGQARLQQQDDEALRDFRLQRYMLPPNHMNPFHRPEELGFGQNEVLRRQRELIERVNTAENLDPRGNR